MPQLYRGLDTTSNQWLQYGRAKRPYSFQWQPQVTPWNFWWSHWVLLGLCKYLLHTVLIVSEERWYFFQTISKRPYQETTLPQRGFVCFLDVHGNISFHTSWWATGKFLLALALTSSFIFLLRLFMIWSRISRHTGLCLTLIDPSSYFLQKKAMK